MKKILICCLMVALSATLVHATGLNMYYNNGCFKDKDGVSQPDGNYHPYTPKMEFYYNSMPASNLTTGRLSWNLTTNYANYPTHDDYWDASLPGGTFYVRFWIGTQNTAGSYYNSTYNYPSTGANQPTDWTISSFLASYKAAAPDTPLITKFEQVRIFTGEGYPTINRVDITSQAGPVTDGLREVDRIAWKVWTGGPGNEPADGSPTYTGSPAVLSLFIPDSLLAGLTYSFKVGYGNCWNSPNYTWSSAVNYTVQGAGGGGQVTASYQLKKKTSSFGINQFSVPITGSVTFDSGATHLVEITTLGGLVNAINTAAGSSIVKTAGWWDKDNQLMIGWTNVDTTPIPQNGAPSTLAGETIIPDKVYQISVSQNINITLTGNR